MLCVSCGHYSEARGFWPFASFPCSWTLVPWVVEVELLSPTASAVLREPGSSCSHSWDLRCLVKAEYCLGGCSQIAKMPEIVEPQR